jgi:hypothetical protein
VAGLVGAVAVGLNETSSHKDQNRAVAALLAIGGLPVGLITGYLLGRQADKEVIIIRIVPNLSAQHLRHVSLFLSGARSSRA